MTPPRLCRWYGRKEGVQRTSQSYDPTPLVRARCTRALSVQRGVVLVLLKAMQEGDEVLLARVLQEGVIH